MQPLPAPEPLALLQAAAVDSVSAGLASLPQDLHGRNSRHVVMLRGRRRVFLLDNGELRNSFPVAIGMPGWETPTGIFEVLQKFPNPVWVHPVSGERVEEQAPKNPLGSHWITFHRDCLGRDAHDGEAWITIKGCTTTGFHGNPHRWTVGRAVSHGCVRLYNEDVSSLYRQVSLGTQVTVLP
ncbi:L,D-transpeptidase [Synechococcus sp. MU1643]|uniref:L,D-transpeptidase n=1 Tax=Synechococcus sp. MU1643 TaxID=2508349 RepID=UPI001CF81695|nr:L,D-transpeptidase [Synechococcus sp. MU1643]MCB4427930.1 L,D-transpeptidase [Synechococcus sp. MU1643]